MDYLLDYYYYIHKLYKWYKFNRNIYGIDIGSLMANVNVNVKLGGLNYLVEGWAWSINDRYDMRYYVLSFILFYLISFYSFLFPDLFSIFWIRSSRPRKEKKKKESGNQINQIK